jgi:hypothetical protein
MTSFCFLMFQVFTSRQFQCRDCFHIGPLDINGCCNNCHSGSVISQELLLAYEC